MYVRVCVYIKSTNQEYNFKNIIPCKNLKYTLEYCKFLLTANL